MRKQLGLFDLTMIVVSFVIGMGIFRTPVNVAAAVPNQFLFYLTWLAGGLVALCGALTYAEIGSRLPATGGYYKVFAYAYHPSIGFAINCIILVSNAASLGAVALVGSEYIVGVWMPMTGNTSWLAEPGNMTYVKTVQIIVAIVAIFIFYLVNMLGLRMSSRTQNVLMVIKITLVVLLILPLFFSQHATDLPTAKLTTITNPTLREYIKAFGVGLVAVSFTFGGYQQTINFGEEIRNPNRTLPRGIFLGISLILLLYMLINYAYVKVIGFEELKTSRNIAAIMASRIFGPGAETVLSVFLFLGVLAYINGSLMSNPRVMYAMGKDGVLPAIVTRKNRFGTLNIALTIFALLGALIVFWAEEFDVILSFTIFLDCFGMALSAGSIFVIRRKTVNLDKTGIFKMRWYPLAPVLFILAYAFVAVSIALDYKKNNYAAVTGLIVLAAFILIYYIFYHRKNKNSKETEHEPF